MAAAAGSRCQIVCTHKTDALLTAQQLYQTHCVAVLPHGNALALCRHGHTLCVQFLGSLLVQRAIIHAVFKAFGTLAGPGHETGQARLSQVAVVVAVYLTQLSVLRLQQRHSRIVAQNALVDLAKRHTAQRAQQDAHSSAMAEHSHRFALVFCGDTAQRAQQAVADLSSCFAVSDSEVFQIQMEIVQLLFVQSRHFLPCPAFPPAQIHLTQILAQPDLQTAHFTDSAGRGAGAEEIAAVHRVDLHAFKAAAQGADLLVAQPGHQAVKVALHQAVEVSLRLGMAHQIDLRHTFPPHSTVTTCFMAFTAASAAASSFAANWMVSSTTSAPWP